MLPLCPFSSTCVTPGISRHTPPDGEPCLFVRMHTECCLRRRRRRCCSVCCYTAVVVVAAAVLCCCFLLPFVMVCRMSKFGAGSLNLIPVFSFSSFKSDIHIFDLPLGSTAVSHLRSRFAYILGNCGHARSQGGRQPAVAKPPLYTVHIRIYLVMCNGCNKYRHNVQP